VARGSSRRGPHAWPTETGILNRESRNPFAILDEVPHRTSSFPGLCMAACPGGSSARSSILSRRSGTIKSLQQVQVILPKVPAEGGQTLASVGPKRRSPRTSSQDLIRFVYWILAFASRRSINIVPCPISSMAPSDGGRKIGDESFLICIHLQEFLTPKPWVAFQPAGKDMLWQ
jgi:hypothetical protein